MPKGCFVRPAAYAKATRTCVVCGAQFMGTKAAKCCGAKCRARQYRGPKTERPCVTCGRLFLASRGRQSCSSACRPQRSYPPPKTRPCLGCGKAIRARLDRLYCGDPCRRPLVDPLERAKGQCSPIFIRPCGRCSRIFATQWESKRYCGRKCNIDAATDRRCDRRVKRFRCRYCGKVFEKFTGAKRLIYCGKTCNDKAADHVSKVRRRLRIHAGPVHVVTLKALIRRDKAVCHLCGDKVRLDLGIMHDLAPSRDHVIPLAKGGTHTWGNIKLAHRICNSIKRDTMPTDAHHAPRQTLMPWGDG